MKRLTLVLAALLVATPHTLARAQHEDGGRTRPGAFAAPPSKADAEQARIERLAGLGRIWGTVRYLHPALATRPVDWDKALVEAIPKADAAKSQAEYVAAINGMLAALGDPATQARLTGAGNRTTDEAPPLPKDAEPIRLDTDKVLHIDAPLVARLLAGGDRSLFSSLLVKVKELGTMASAVVLDLRRPDRAADDERLYQSFFMSPALDELLDRQVPLPSARMRMHSGYAPQTGGASFYYSSLVTRTPILQDGRRKGEALRWSSSSTGSRSGLIMPGVCAVPVWPGSCRKARRRMQTLP